MIEVNDLKRSHVIVSKDEFIKIAQLSGRWIAEQHKHLSIPQEQNSERKQLINRLGYLELWKKRSIANTQRMFTLLNTRISELEKYQGQLNASENIERICKRLNHVENTLNVDEEYQKIVKYVDETRRYLGGELDTLTKYLKETQDHVKELERKEHISELFESQLSERITKIVEEVNAFGKAMAITQNIYRNLNHNQNGLAGEQSKQQIDIKHLNGRLREVEAKQVSTEIKKDEFREGSLAQALHARAVKKLNKNIGRDAKGRFVKR